MIKRSKLILTGLAIVAFAALSAAAQTTRVYVANSGSDASLCTKSAECKTITKALSVVDDNGEVIITESGDYDTFVVSKSVTVAAAPGVNAGIVSSNTYAILVTVGQPQLVDKITIRNLNLKNISRQDSTAGIYNSTGTNLFVDNCTFTGFQQGIGEGNTPGKLFVHDSTFRDNLYGIGINTPNTEGGIIAVIDNCRIEHNEVGVVVTAKTFVTIRNSVISDNASFGVYVGSKTSLRAEAVIDNCLLSGNTDGIKIGSANGVSIARLSRSTITENTLYGVVIGATSTFYSFQNNVIAGNPTDISGNITNVSVK